LEGLEVPRLGDVGEERARNDAVDPNQGAERARQARGEVVDAGLGRAASSFGDGRWDATEETKMIEPPGSAAAIFVPISADSRNGPLRLTAITLSYSCSVTASTLGYSGDIPALLTRTSQRPNCA
jgi:hypothetical protein